MTGLTRSTKARLSRHLNAFLLRFFRDSRRRPTVRRKVCAFETASPSGTGLFNTRGILVMQHPWFMRPIHGMLTRCRAHTRFRSPFVMALAPDVSRETFTVVVDHPPEVLEIFVPESIFAGSSISFDAEVFDTEAGSEMEIYRDLDVEDGSISERDERILTEYSVRWDFDIEVDLNENGDPADDWLTPVPGSTVRTNNTWEETGFYPVMVEVCDGMGQCASMTGTSRSFPNQKARPRYRSSVQRNGSRGLLMQVRNWRRSWRSSWSPWSLAGWLCESQANLKKKRKRQRRPTPTLNTLNPRAASWAWIITNLHLRQKSCPKMNGAAMIAAMSVPCDAVE